MKKTVLILNNKSYPKSSILELRKFFFVITKNFADQKTFVNFLKKKKKTNRPIFAIFFDLKFSINNKIIKYLENKNYIISPTTAINHIKIKNINTKIIYLKKEKKLLNKIMSTAELAIAMILILARKLKNVQYKNLKTWDKNEFFGQELNGKKIFIFGYGRLGKKVEKICKSFGMKTIIYDKYKKKYSRLNINALKNADIITVHMDYRISNINFIDKKIITKFKKEVIFINTSRGEIIDQEQLIKRYENGKIGGLGLDVLDNENNNSKINKKILKLSKNRNVIITPHIGGYTKEATFLTRDFVVKKFLNHYL